MASSRGELMGKGRKFGARPESARRCGTGKNNAGLVNFRYAQDDG
jgi:hypothetical protein